MSLCAQLWAEEAGFVISAELVLISTIVVLGLIVGLSEVQHAVVSELNDVGDAIGQLNQSYYYSGLSSYKNYGQIKAAFAGSAFRDVADDCDNNQCDISCDGPTPESPKSGY